MMKQTFKMLSATLLVLSIAVQMHASDYTPRIIAGVVKADSWTMGNNKEGIYQLNVSTQTLTQLSEGGDAFMAPLGGAVYVDGKMKGIHFKQEYDPYEGGNVYTIYNMEYDMATWTRTKGKALSNLYANLISSCGLAHDAASGLNYGIFYNFNMDMQVLNRKLATIDFSTDTPTKSIIDNVETPFAAIAFHPTNGFLYGVGQDGFLYIIDTVDASLYPLGDLGIEDISTYPSSMTFDARTGKLYWSYVSSAAGNKSYLYEISYALGSVSATQLMQVPDNAYLVNLYIAPTVAGAPTAATDLLLNFEGEKTTGSVSFTMPATDQDGESLSGTLTYTVTANGSQVATGTAAPGTSVTKEVTVPASGMTEISVIVSNDKGQSDAVKISAYIGHDVPTAATNVTLAYNAATGKAELTWNAPTTGKNGKTLTQANLRYTVVRQSDNTTVATDLRETAFSEVLSNEGSLTAYYYEVTTVNGEQVGDKATSNTIVLGDALVPPFEEPFTTDAGFNRFTVIDANDDGTTWQRYHKYYQYSGTTVDAAAITANRNNADDDWLMTPPVKMERGSRYALTFSANKAYAATNYNQKMEVWMGQGDDPTTFTKVGETLQIDNVNATDYELELIPTADGNYRVAFHAVSNANSDQLLLNYVKIAAPLVGTAPEAATNLTLTAGDKGVLTATVSLTAPSTNIRGDQLTALSKIEVLNEQNSVVGTITNPTPGQPCTISCTNLTNGNNTLTVIAYNGNDAGAKAYVSGFVGVDRPTAPRNAQLLDDGEEAYVTWEAPTEGYYGYYINPDALKYNLYTIDNEGYADPFADHITSPYKTGVATNTGDQQLLYYALDAESAAGYGPLTATNSLVIGQPYPTPFEESFGNGVNTSQFIWFEGEEFSRNFTLNSDAADADGTALFFTPNYSTYGIFSTGKIDISQAAQPTVEFWYKGVAGDKASLIALIDMKPQNTYTPIADIDFTQATTGEWTKVVTDLTAYKSVSPYVILRFSFVSVSDTYESIGLDGIRVYDGASSGISMVNNHAGASQDVHTPTYNLAGQRVGPGYRGIAIRNGKKTVIK